MLLCYDCFKKIQDSPARLSQITCAVTIVHIMCVQKVLHAHKNLCTVLISLCKNSLNLPVCSFFFLLCAWLPPPLVHCVVMFATLLHCANFFVCFYGSRFCSPAINQISLSKLEGWSPFI